MQRLPQMLLGVLVSSAFDCQCEQIVLGFCGLSSPAATCGSTCRTLEEAARISVTAKLFHKRAVAE
jgi:hypothetical protein